MSVIPLLDAITPIVNKVLSYIPDPEQKLKAQMDLLNTVHQWDADQAAINIEEAKSENLFVSGWRPFIGWVCGVAFAYHFVLQPLLAFAMVANGHEVALPAFDMDTLFTVLAGMLGLGGLRTLEKFKGV